MKLNQIFKQIQLRQIQLNKEWYLLQREKILIKMISQKICLIITQFIHQDLKPIKVGIYHIFTKLIRLLLIENLLNFLKKC